MTIYLRASFQVIDQRSGGSVDGAHLVVNRESAGEPISGQPVGQVSMPSLDQRDGRLPCDGTISVIAGVPLGDGGVGRERGVRLGGASLYSTRFASRFAPMPQWLPLIAPVARPSRWCMA